MPTPRKRKPAKAVKKPAKKATKPAKRAQQSPTSPKKPQVKRAVDRVKVFITEYLVDLNGRQAAIRAGYSPQSARFTAHELLGRADVQEAVAKAMVERSTRTGITADRVLERLWSIATADPRELIELHRGCCRYCWGKNNRHQYTPREMDERRAAHAEALAEAKEPSKVPLFDEAGGIGWNPKRDPNANCPECFGDGVEHVIAKDTRDLSVDARRLFAGVKVTQHGLEMKTHDQKGALVDLGKHLGLFREKVELTGKDGKDLPMGVVVVPAKVRPADEAPAVESEAEAFVDAAKPAREFKVRKVSG